MKPKILLVCPTSKGIDALPLPPLGMLSISAYLKKHGYEVRVMDMYIDGSSYHLLKNIIWSDIVGISGLSSHQFENSKSIGEMARQFGKLTVFGGIHATTCPEESAPFFDLVVRGEGEKTMLDIANKFPNNLDLIDGTTYLDERRGKVIHNPDREMIKNIDTLPLPDRDAVPPTLYPFRELKRFEGRYTSILGGRGCPNKCIFCASPNMWKRARMHSSARVFEEMMEIYNKWGIKNIHFHDDTFTLKRERVMNLCQMILDSGIPFKWSCITRPDKVDRELLGKMKEAGCVQIEMGAESASNKLLKVAKKHYTMEQVRKAFNLANEMGLNTYGYFIIGLPGENLWTWLKTTLFAKSLKLNSCVFTILSPFPGTEAYKKNMVKILSENCWLYKKPVVRVGMLTPRVLMILRKISDVFVNGRGYHGAYKKKQQF